MFVIAPFFCLLARANMRKRLLYQVSLYNRDNLLFSMFRYKADILPVTLFFLYFLLDVYVYFSVSALAFLLPYVAVSIVIK